ncbi:hypothetical protein U9M48_009701 [Paspalum notatum var. saurae]|uniref:Uncharacterized protein n=1 Tax=Paspalum notatum var. saurae TaxID=547442 RepID=A0AAQ3SRQ8_PASNO
MPAGGHADSPPRLDACPSGWLQNYQCVRRRLRVHCGTAARALWNSSATATMTAAHPDAPPSPPPRGHAYLHEESESTAGPLWSSSPPLPVPHDNIGDCPFFDVVSVLASSDRPTDIP